MSEYLYQDSKEDIDSCLHCPYIECGDCLDKTGKTTELALGVMEGIQVMTPPDPNKLHGKKRAVYDYYIEGYTDSEIAELVGSKKSYVTHLRLSIGLPYLPIDDTQKNRKALIQKWIQKK